MRCVDATWRGPGFSSRKCDVACTSVGPGLINILSRITLLYEVNIRVLETLILIIIGYWKQTVQNWWPGRDCWKCSHMYPYQSSKRPNAPMFRHVLHIIRTTKPSFTSSFFCWGSNTQRIEEKEKNQGFENDEWLFWYHVMKNGK